MFTWAWENLWKYFMPCNGIFFGIFIFHMEKYSMTWHGIFYHVICIFFWDQQWFIDSKHGYGKHSSWVCLMWGFEDQKKWISSSLVQPIFQMCKAHVKENQNCWNRCKLHGWKIFDEIKFSKSFHICQTCVEMAKVLQYYTWNNIHESVMTVKSFIVGIGLNVNKFISNTNVYSPKKIQYTFHGNWNLNFLHNPGNNYKLHKWENHNWFDAHIILMYYH